jgi:crotonobetainyl-CoA:carnitine CoA-transferase CaiB-like acyl-CoA transferase
MPLAALGEILAQAGLPPPRRGQIEIAGDDPVFPTRFRVGTAGAAVVAAAALAAAELWALRNGQPPQGVAVDLRHAAAALRGARYLRIDDKPPKEIFDALSGLYQARDDRWVFLHCNFANHRQAALSVLGLPADSDRAAVAAAVRAHDSPALEDAVHGAAGCAALVRSAEEWSQHPQSAAVAALPFLEIERIGDAPAEKLPAAGDRPLAGIRVLDLTRVLAGPTCARTLAEHGADVLKVSGQHLPHSGEIEIDTGLGKLSSFLDLRQPRDATTLAALIGEGRCDVFSQSYRPGALAGRGLGAAELAALRPGIVYVELSAWGREGPWARRRGFDTIVQCASGMAMVEGGGERPRLLPVSAIDYVSGYLMALGAMTALKRRAEEGGSWRVRVSLARTGKWIVDRGLLDPTAIAGVPGELPRDEIARIRVETPSVLGRVRHLAPVARMSETPARWARPPVPLGHDAPAWPPR